MNVLIVTDQHVFKIDEVFYAEYAFNCVLERYVSAFGNITLYARTGNAKDISKSATKVEQVQVIPAGNNADIFTGRTKAILKRLIPQYDLLILRLDSFLAYQAAPIARKNQIPYMTESMSCAWDGLWNHSLKGKFLAPIMFLKMKKTVWNAQYATYVTSEFLQKRYPCRVKSLAASNVMIDPPNVEVFNARLKKICEMSEKEIILMTAGGVNIKYKGFQFVIKAIPLINNTGIRVKYYIVGNGDNSYLKRIAEECGVIDQVIFIGAVPHDQVLNYMDTADIYIQPSLQEGLPRTVIEAMSRACPSIGARTAGIPELIPDECVVERKSVKGIANAVLNIFNKEKMIQLAQINFKEAFKYSNDILSQRRTAYYEWIVYDLSEKMK